MFTAMEKNPHYFSLHLHCKDNGDNILRIPQFRYSAVDRNRWRCALGRDRSKGILWRAKRHNSPVGRRSIRAFRFRKISFAPFLSRKEKEEIKNKNHHQNIILAGSGDPAYFSLCVLAYTRRAVFTLSEWRCFLRHETKGGGPLR
jgi:hypothetical protein